MSVEEHYCSECYYFDIVHCFCTNSIINAIKHPLDGEECDLFLSDNEDE